MKLAHISWNLAGLTLPLAIAAIAIPKLLENLGAQRFGLLALAWGLIGYASALDLGIGRALTQAMSKMLGTKRSIRNSELLDAALQITLLSGGLAFLAIVSLALFGAQQWIGAPEVPSHEKTASIILLALALPMQSISATYKGVNEAHLNFKKISILRVGLGAANFGAPYAISIATQKMYWLVASLVLSRAISLFFYRKFAIELIKRDECIKSKSKIKITRLLKIRLMKFAGWITISSIINPIVNAADRFLLASLVSASAVTLYVIPFELATQSLILVGAISTVFFPYAARSTNLSQVKIKKDFSRVIVISACIMGCVTLVYLTLGGNILEAWLGAKFDQKSKYILQIISLGLIPYAVASISTSLIHSHGSSNLTTIVNMAMFMPAIAGIYVLVKYFGPVGAAAAWTIRILIEAICFYAIARWKISKLKNVAPC